MERKYNLNLDELMDFFASRHKGCSEQEIEAAEQEIGAKLPDFYRQFLLKYGKDSVNTACQRIREANEICTSYQSIQERLEDDDDFAGDFKEAVENGEQEEYADDPYFQLWQLPIEKWNTITDNYVYISDENQCIWVAGYLLSDLQAGNPNPPVYISTEDDEITFAKSTENTEEFLFFVLSDNALGECEGERYTKKQDIEKILTEHKLDIEQLKVQHHMPSQKVYYFGTCRDNETLYFYYLQDDYEELKVICNEKHINRRR